MEAGSTRCRHLTVQPEADSELWRTYPRFSAFPHDFVPNGRSSIHFRRQQFSKSGVPRPVTVKVSQFDQSIIDHHQILSLPNPVTVTPEATTRRDGRKPNKKTTGHTGIPTNGRIDFHTTGTSMVVVHRGIIQSSVPRLVQPRV